MAGFLVAPGATQGFAGLTRAVRVDLMLSLLAGGGLAAPIAPRLVRRLRPRLLGVGVGGFVALTNARTLLHASGASWTMSAMVHAALALAWLAALVSVALVKTRDGVAGGDVATVVGGGR